MGRSPSMVRWPGKIAPNSVSDLQWAFWDLMPTLCELAGCLDRVPSVTDGISIVPTLLGPASGQHQEKHEYMYFTWNGNKVYSKKHPKSGYSVRVGDWKGVVQHCNTTENVPSLADEMELYDLNADPFEGLNVASRHQDVVERLKRLTISKDLTCDCYQC